MNYPEGMISALFFVWDVVESLEFEVKYTSSHSALVCPKANCLTSLNLSLYFFKNGAKMAELYKIMVSIHWEHTYGA